MKNDLFEVFARLLFQSGKQSNDERLHNRTQALLEWQEVRVVQVE
jgi:hypothetical protein